MSKSANHQIIKSTHLGVSLLLMLAGCIAAPAAFTPMQPIGPDQYSHRHFDDVLHDHVKDGVVNYPAIADDIRFPAYVAQLDHIDPNAFSTQEERLAFWINAYNAFAIQGILDGLSPETLWGRYKYFLARKYRVGGVEVNLYDLERAILIRDFREPRIHFAIVCASRSCPKMRSEAYQASRLHEQLDDQARAFINDISKNRFDRAVRVARLSKIFDWFDDAFIAHSGSLIEYVRRYVADADLQQDLDPHRYSVRFMDYDWKLNGPPPTAMREK